MLCRGALGRVGGVEGHSILRPSTQEGIMKPTITYQKLRGGYYTPEPIAQFLARWAIQSPDDEVLEPSCGDGIMLAAAVTALASHGVPPATLARRVYAVEIDADEARKAATRLEKLGIPVAGQIHVGDFFAYCKQSLATTTRFDAIIGNPPFVRYQNFPEDQRQIAFGLMARVGLKPNRLTNTWVPFLVASTLLLKQHGRLAMVIPAELLQVNYAAQLRCFISEHYRKLTLITFKKLVFDDIQQEVVLLLAEKHAETHTGIRTIEMNDMSDLATYQHTVSATQHLKSMSHSTEKWTQYFLEEAEIQLLRTLRQHPGLTLAGEVIDVDVGIVTGLNEFFVLNKQQMQAYELERYTQPIVGRSGHMQGIIFSTADWEENAAQQRPAYLVTFPDSSLGDLSHAAQAYIANGEAQSQHTGYKCRIRNRWYVVPSVWTPAAFMLRQVHHYPKLILNDAGATCTDTIHRVRLRNGIAGKIIVAAFLNSLTFAFAEVIGRSYGGGVLELEPNEAEKLPLPLAGADKLDLNAINQLLLTEDIHAVLAMTDTILLRNGLGLTIEQVKTLRGIWEKLRDRRIQRR